MLVPGDEIATRTGLIPDTLPGDEIATRTGLIPDTPQPVNVQPTDPAAASDSLSAAGAQQWHVALLARYMRCGHEGLDTVSLGKLSTPRICAEAVLARPTSECRHDVFEYVDVGDDVCACVPIDVHCALTAAAEPTGWRTGTRPSRRAGSASLYAIHPGRKPPSQPDQVTPKLTPDGHACQQAAAGRKVPQPAGGVLTVGPTIPAECCFVTVVPPLVLPNASGRNAASAIPLVVHQMTRDGYTGEQLVNTPQFRVTIEDANREFAFWHHSSDRSCVCLVRHYFAGTAVERAYNRLAIGAAKSDLCRYIVLFLYGGVYLDWDQRVLDPLGPLVSDPQQHGHLFTMEHTGKAEHGPNVLGEQGAELAMQNGFLASLPRSPLLLGLVEMASHRICAGEPNVFQATGPGLINDMWTAWGQAGRPDRGAMEPRFPGIGRYYGIRVHTPFDAARPNAKTAKTQRLLNYDEKSPTLRMSNSWFKERTTYTQGVRRGYAPTAGGVPTAPDLLHNCSQADTPCQCYSKPFHSVAGVGVGCAGGYRDITSLAGCQLAATSLQSAIANLGATEAGHPECGGDPRADLTDAGMCRCNRSAGYFPTEVRSNLNGPGLCTSFAPPLGGARSCATLAECRVGQDYHPETSSRCRCTARLWVDPREVASMAASASTPLCFVHFRGASSSSPVVRYSAGKERRALVAEPEHRLLCVLEGALRLASGASIA